MNSVMQANSRMKIRLNEVPERKRKKNEEIHSFKRIQFIA